MRTVAIVLGIVFLSCASARPHHCEARDWLSHAMTAKPTTYDDIERQYLREVNLDAMPTLPPEAREGVMAWIHGEIRRVQGKQRAGDELWYFREEKCPGCHWYREGLALVRGCTVVDEIVISDDM